MKKISVIIFLTFLFINGNSQESIYCWPIQGQKIGEGILYKPQDYVDEELNFDNLFITAKEGTTVLAPCDGNVKIWYYAYNLSLQSSFSFPVKTGSDVELRDKISQEIRENKGISIDPKYISITLGISSKNGETYRVTGLRPLKQFKTGYEIKKGEEIGTVGYCYKAISMPGINVSRSINGKPADPMTVFGLRSTFISPTKKIPHQVYSMDQLKEDFSIFRESLEEGHPGLYDYVSKTCIDSLFERTLLNISKPMSASEFFHLLEPVIMEIRDSHTNLYRDEEEVNVQIPFKYSVYFGWQNDSLIITRSTEQYKEYLGKRILEINGKNSDSLFSEINGYFKNSSEGFIESLQRYHLLSVFWLDYFKLYPLRNGDLFTITFSDGTKKNFPYWQTSSYPKLIPDWSNYRKPPKSNFDTKKLNYETALLDLNTFSLTEKDMDSISQFIKEIHDSSYKNLIIDVRNNMGGHSVEDLYSLIARKPFKTLITSKVNQNNTYHFFKYCTNHSEDENQVFSEYKKISGKEGYYLPKDSIQWSYPNDSINFGGNIFVLTDEFSQSAATIFPALVYKYKRGLIVGRETGSAYYQVNAVKFANVSLRNTGITLRIPLVKCVFDSAGMSDIPWGRGVLPDYNVPITVDEFTCESDNTLNFTLSLIEKFKISKNEIIEEAALKHANRHFALVLTSCLVLCVVVSVFLIKKGFVSKLFYSNKHE